MAKKKLPSALERQLAQAVPTTPDATPEPKPEPTKRKAKAKPTTERTTKFLMEFNEDLDMEISMRATQTRQTKKNVILQALKDAGFKNVGEIRDKRRKLD